MAKVGILDLGSGYLKVVIAEGDNITPTILAAQHFRSKGVNKGAIVKTSLARKVLKEALEQIENLIGDNLKTYHVLISHPAIKSENVKVRLPLGENPVEITEEHLNRLQSEAFNKAKENGYTVIHTLPKYFLLDGEKYYEPLGLWASNLEAEYHIIKLPVSVEKNIHRLLVSVGYKPGKILFPSLMAYKVVLDEDEAELNSLIIDIGYTTSGFLYVKEGAPTESGVVDVGLKNVIEAIAKYYKVPSKEIENLIENYGLENLLTENEQSMVVTIKPREDRQVEVNLVEFTQLLAEQIGYLLEKVLLEVYKKGINLDKDLDRFIFVGGFANIKGLKLFLESLLEKEIRIGKPSTVDSMEPDVDSPLYTPAIGATVYLEQYAEEESFYDLFGLPEKEQSIDLPPIVEPELNEEEKPKGFFKRIIASIKRLFSED